MSDDRLAFAAQPIDQRADAGSVFRIGTLDLIDFGVHQRFEFHRACQRALDAFAHRRDLAANGLADHHHPILREVFRLRETERHFGHGLGGNAHFLGATDHHRECPEKNDWNDRTDAEQNPIRARQNGVERTGLPDGRAEKTIGKYGSAAKPAQRKQRHNPIDCVGRSAVQAMQKRPVVFLPIVVRRRESGGLIRRLALQWTQFGIVLGWRNRRGGRLGRGRLWLVRRIC